jgi:serine/threonine kinase 32
MYAIKDALDIDPNKRLGSTWESFTQHEFFSCIDFEALERKEIEPVFVPSSEKTNFDATYDLEELLLEEAPLEARARRQKPRERLKDDATDKEIREDELYRMIDTDFRPFDYTVAAYKKYADSAPSPPTKSHTDPCPPRITQQQEALSTGQDSSTSSKANLQPQALTTDEATPSPTTNGATTSRPSNENNTSTSNSSSTKQAQQKQQQRRNNPPGRTAPLAPYPQSYTPNAGSGGRAGRAFAPGMMVGSPTGGVQVTLDGGSSWSDLARQDATLPADASGANNEPGKDGSIGSGSGSGSGGVFGFLRGKKGRGNSPKPKERGVLGKEGARVVLG